MVKAVHDGVDILNLSVGPNSPPATTKTTFLNPFDATLLSAVKAGVFVAQAAGNGGPFPKTLISYSPWIMSVAAAIDDRQYKNHLILGNGKILPGLGLSRKYHIISILEDFGMFFFMYESTSNRSYCTESYPKHYGSNQMQLPPMETNRSP